ncbi:hypothetical protein [Commensalibacter communis]|uniref:hypothetical protein n=1 Tax=Commensalibacter communis TaxID=2972786 RepID=UPI0022FF7DDA|nr:hypothetical protein [Commensalibacter communis]CAI3951448.1 unnamed protein product [Commensalibacter communis]CAI3953783.1 unnamed protein product [Commensalibacter communis]
MKQMGIKASAFFYVLQGLAAGCAIIIPLPFIFFLVNTCYECFKDMNNLSEEEMKMWVGIQDIGFVTHPSEVISGVAFMVMIGFFIYLTLLLGIWVLSGCVYGKIRGTKVSDNIQ